MLVWVIKKENPDMKGTDADLAKALEMPIDSTPDNVIAF